jgi:hypothetical protein
MELKKISQLLKKLPKIKASKLFIEKLNRRIEEYESKNKQS